MPEPIRRFFTVPFVVALGLLTIAAIAMPLAIDHFKISIKKLPIHPEGGRLLTSVPFETSSWVCTTGDHRETAEVEATLGTKNYITRVYLEKFPAQGKKPRSISLHAAYYTGMIDTVPHVADRCFVAGGMQLGTLTQDLPLPLDRTRFMPDRDVPEQLKGRITKVRSSDGVYVRMPRDPDTIKIHTMKFIDHGKDLYAGYFFVANGGCVARAEDVRLLAFNLSATYAFYMKVQVTTPDVTSQEELAALSAQLLDELFGDLMRCTPDWVEVEAGRYPPPTDTDGSTPPGGNA
ncbi:MAG TPA: hypothetical protein VD997_00055 [Phycisphaerales bacterium]|nr:hypothetical protein [Phycisphaerales bacterium]